LIDLPVVLLVIGTLEIITMMMMMDVWDLRYSLL